MEAGGGRAGGGRGQRQRANGHHSNDGIGPSVELVPGVSHTNGNGHHDEAPEPPALLSGRQQSLFSWAEFMAEEPVKPKRNGKPQPASLSMFEWAMEQEREKETVGAGR